jgi:hypothetical protein
VNLYVEFKPFAAVDAAISFFTGHCLKLTTNYWASKNKGSTRHEVNCPSVIFDSVTSDEQPVHHAPGMAAAADRITA